MIKNTFFENGTFPTLLADTHTLANIHGILVTP